MRLLILGGTHHVGRALAEAALAGGDQVTTLNRGLTGRAVPGAAHLTADRTDPPALRAALGDQGWDAVLDTWSGAPVAVAVAAGLLAGRVGHYTYVSSRSVYRWPWASRADETAPVVDGDLAGTGSDDYAAAKRGGELAALAAFGDRVLLARAGLILGPYEQVGRLPWWLRRLERGGDVLAPGPAGLALQYIDARDLANWLLAAAQRGLGGPYNVVSRSGHATMAGLLEAVAEVTGSRAKLVWTPPEAIEAAGIEPWTELPIWAPPTGEHAAVHDWDVSAALGEGLTCRPVAETVTDTWRWLQAEGDPTPRHGTGLDPAKERRVLAGLAPLRTHAPRPR